MKIDLCRLFGVEEGEEFILETKDGWFNDLKYKIENNIIKDATIKYSDYSQSSFKLNEFVRIEKIIKLPKKKQFTDDELCILRNIDKKYKWIARDKSGSLCILDEKPKKSEEMWDNVTHSDFIELNCYNSLFNSIQWEDEEPIRIDDYVERKESV